nr:hypothetical protein [Tanacetum cinerariifolium]
MDELHPAYDFFTPGPLPGYACNPNNINGWIEADVPLLGKLGKEQMVALVMDVEEGLAVLFSDDEDSVDDDSEVPEGDEEVWEMNKEWLMAPVTPSSMPAVPPPGSYEVGGPSSVAAEGQSFTLLAPGFPVPPTVIEDLCTRIGNLEYGHGQLAKKVIKVSDTKEADGIAIGINVWVKLLEEENLFTPTTDSCASNLTPIDCMERVSCESLSSSHPEGKIPTTYSKVVGKIVRWLDDEIPRNRILTLRMDLLGVSRFPRWVEANVQPMAMKKTSFLEMESSGSKVVNIPGSSRIRIRY